MQVAPEHFGSSTCTGCGAAVHVGNAAGVASLCDCAIQYISAAMRVVIVVGYDDSTGSVLLVQGIVVAVSNTDSNMPVDPNSSVLPHVSININTHSKLTPGSPKVHQRPLNHACLAG
jgi:hypothetical protein